MHRIPAYCRSVIFFIYLFFLVLFVKKETLCCPFRTKIRPLLLKVSRYLVDSLNIGNEYLNKCLIQFIRKKLQLNKTNTSNTAAPFLDLNLLTCNDIISTKIYDKRNDFDFDIIA